MLRVASSVKQLARNRSQTLGLGRKPREYELIETGVIEWKLLLGDADVSNQHDAMNRHNLRTGPLTAVEFAPFPMTQRLALIAHPTASA